jgi:histone H3/H4
MTTRKRSLALASMEKVMKHAGVDRVGEDAKEALRDVLEEIGEEIAHKAMKLAMHAGRKTVKAEDVRLAKHAE